MAKQKKLKTLDYLGLSTALRAKEAKLLNRDQLERMLSESGFAETCRVAADAGYEDMSDMDVSGINAALERRRAAELEELLSELPDPELADLLTLQYDCHNAKTLVKAQGDLRQGEGIFSGAGRWPITDLKAAWDDEDSGQVPTDFANAIREARQILSRTGNPQQADFTLDKAYFARLLALAENSGRPFLQTYVRNRIDKVNLRSLLRTMDMRRREDLLANALIEGGTIPLDQISDPTLTKEDVLRLYGNTIFSSAAEAENMTAFEKTADNAELDSVSSGSLIPFGPEVVLEYVTALENEILALRVILTGKRMGISSETLRERLRECYG